MMYEWNDGTSYLVHHGTKGQKWGVRRYQNPDGTLTALGRARLGLKGTYDGAKNAVKNIKNAMKQRKLKKQRAANLKKANAAKKAKAEEQAMINKALASGDAEQINKIRDKLTTEQINAAMLRIDAMNKLNTKAEGPSKTEIAFNKLSEINKYMDTGISFYNNFAKISNGFFGTDLRQLDGKLGSEIRSKLEDSGLDLDKKREELRKSKAEADKSEALAEAERLKNNQTKENQRKQKEKELESKKKAAEEEAKRAIKEQQDRRKRDEQNIKDKITSTIDKVQSEKAKSNSNKDEEDIPYVKAEPVYADQKKADYSSFKDVPYEDIKSNKSDVAWVTTNYGPTPILALPEKSSAGKDWVDDYNRKWKYDN